MAGNSNFNTLLSTTINNIIPEYVDNAFSSKPLLWILQNKGRIQNKAGGVKCVVPLLYAESKNHGSYSGSETFATEDDDELTAAEFDWKQYYGLIKIDGITKAKNSGKEALIDILDTRMDVLRMTISEHLDEMFLGDGTGNGGKDFLGLKGLIGTGDLGNIPTATNTWWKSAADTTSETFATWGGIDGMANLFNTASEGNDHPDHVITTQTTYEAYEASLVGQARFMDPEVIDAGFQNLLYKGIPIVFDKYVDTGYMYMLNSKYITFYTLADTWFEPSELHTPANQDVVYKYVKLYGQFTVSNRQRHGVKSGLTG